MLFNKKKKPKVDPRIRFQNRQFNQKLDRARNFKRTTRSIPEGSFSKFLTQIGLGSRWRQLFAVLILGAIIYVVYIPNFLTWQSIKIEGMTDEQRAKTEQAINDSIKSAKFFNPQHNILFLSKRRLSNAILSVGAVDHINSIHKNLKDKTITISITSKYERFLVRSSDAVYDVYNDGAVKGVAGVSRDDWQKIQNPSMIKIEVDGKITNPDNKEFLTPDAVKYINSVQEEAKGIVGSSLAYIKVPLPQFRQPASPSTDVVSTKPNTNQNSNTNSAQADQKQISSPDLPEPIVEPIQHSEVQTPLNTDELEIFMQKGNDPSKTFRVIVDTKESAHDLVQRLNLLLSQTAPDRYNGLVYIDMRIQTRAFECVAGAACSR